MEAEEVKSPDPDGFFFQINLVFLADFQGRVGKNVPDVL